MYDTADDPYCYPGTHVLKNKLGIKDAGRLQEFEAEVTSIRSTEAMPAGELDVRHFQAIHRHLFQDVYDWAGLFREVRIHKSGSTFCYPEHIAVQLDETFAWLENRNFLRDLIPEQFCEEAAHFLAVLNAIHAFRDGNGRAQMTFLVVLAVQAEHPLNLDHLDADNFLDAMIASFHGDEASLASQLEELIV